MKLGGIMFCRNAIQWDYCYKETIRCLQGFCDQVVILDAGSDDGTTEDLLQFDDQNTMIVSVNKELWDLKRGKEKLAYFQNVALSFLSTEYYFLLQADEILHESCFDAVHEAIASADEAFLVKRINLWQAPNYYINVPENRQPCSTRVVRLAKTKYLSVGDGESIEAQASDRFFEDIRITHYGFVRNKNVMKNKIINMQENVFRIDHDPKLDKMDVFDSKAWFEGHDLSIYYEPHSKYIQEWISTRP